MVTVSRLNSQATAAVGKRLPDEPIPLPSAAAVTTVSKPVNGSETDLGTEPKYLSPHASRDQRFAFWLIAQIFTPQRTARFLRWFPWTYLQVRKFFEAWRWGKRVRKDVYAARMAECGKCPGRVVRIKVIQHANGQPGWVGKEYCGKCGCPEWPLSELKRKNWMVGWKCPLRRHEGLYGDETYRHLLPNKGGCSSCGGG